MAGIDGLVNDHLVSPNVEGSCGYVAMSYYKYHVFYGGNEIMQLWSCVELDDAFFEMLFKSIVTTRVKE